MKIDKCDRCQFYSNSPHLVCAVHPSGVEKDCLDYRLNPEYIFEEQWCPDGYVYYDGELIKLPEKPSRERQLWLLDNHPAFTGNVVIIIPHVLNLMIVLSVVQSMNKWHNFYKLLLGYCLIMATLLVVDHYFLTDNPTSTEPCIIGNEVTTMAECYDIMLNGL